MPALANIHCYNVPSGLTLTGEMYPDGSDTAAATGLTVTEQTNRKTVYVVNAGVTGLHLINLKSGSNVVWSGFSPSNLQITGDFAAYESREQALLANTVSDIATDIDGLPQTIWEYAERTLTSFGSLVSAITTAVWAAASRTLTAFGFSVTATVDEEAIALAVAAELESTGVEITVTSQALIDGGELEIVIGDDYYDADDRAVTCRIEQTGVGLLTTDEWSLILNTIHTTPQTTIGTPTRVDDDTLDLSFDVPSTKTSVLRVGDGDWCVRQTKNLTDRIITPVRGELCVLTDLSTIRH